MAETSAPIGQFPTLLLWPSALRKTHMVERTYEVSSGKMTKNLFQSWKRWNVNLSIGSRLKSKALHAKKLFAPDYCMNALAM